MKTIRIGTAGGLNQHWQRLASEHQVLWFLKDPTSRSLAESNRTGQSFTDWVSWVHEILSRAGLNPPRLLGYDQQQALLRLALRDARCQSFGDLQQATELPGMVRRLLQNVRSQNLRAFEPEPADVNYREESLNQLTFIYRDLQEQSGTTDETGLLLRFLTELGTDSAQSAMRAWYHDLAKSGQSTPIVAIPRADRLNDIERTIAMNLFDIVERMEIGFADWPDDRSESQISSLENWLALGKTLEQEVLQPDAELPESRFLDRSGGGTSSVHFLKTAHRSEQPDAMFGYLNRLRSEGIALDDVAIFTTNGDRQIDHLFALCIDWQIGLRGLKRPLVEAPEVRTLLDVASGVRDNWPVEALVDLLRHPNFQESALEGSLSRMDVLRLAADIARLGNLNGIETIRDMLFCKWAEVKRADQPADQVPTYRIGANPFLSHLNRILALPAMQRTWQEHLDWLNTVQETLLNLTSNAPLAELFDHLNTFSAMEQAVSNGDWEWSEFLHECQIQADQKIQDVTTAAPNQLRIYLNQVPEMSLASHLFCLDMNEGHFPDKQQLSKGLRRAMPLDALYRLENRRFQELCGLATRNLTMSFGLLDDKGVESEPAGFLREMPWEFAADRLPGDSIAQKPRTDSEQRFFNQATGLFAQRKIGNRQYLGRFSSSMAHKKLQSRIGPEHGFSPTALEIAALCHFQFFTKYVLRLIEDEVAEDLTTDYLAEGSVIHEVLEELHLLNPDLNGASYIDLQRQMLDLIRKHHTPTQAIEDSPLGRGRWAVERRRIEQRLAAYIDQLKKLNDQEQGENVSHSNVLILGLEVSSSGPDAKIKPLAFNDDETGEAILVHGKIDRIDATIDGDRASVRLIDYKTGSAIPADKVKKKLHLQLPLYALMLDQNMFKGKQLQVEDLGFWYLKKSLKGYRSIVSQLFGKDGSFDIASIRQNYLKFVAELVRDLRQGHFDIAPQINKCEEYCPINEICRIREIREHPGMRAKPSRS